MGEHPPIKKVVAVYEDGTEKVYEMMADEGPQMTFVFLTPEQGISQGPSDEIVTLLRAALTAAVLYSLSGGTTH